VTPLRALARLPSVLALAGRGWTSERPDPYRDSFGDPLVRVNMDWTDNERNLRAYLIPKFLELMRTIPG
jgi:hypothetical protein